MYVDLNQIRAGEARTPEESIHCSVAFRLRAHTEQENGDPDQPVLTLSNNSGACEIAGLTLRAGSVGIMGTATEATVRQCAAGRLDHGV